LLKKVKVIEGVAAVSWLRAETSPSAFTSLGVCSACGEKTLMFTKELREVLVQLGWRNTPAGGPADLEAFM
jgi:hypothetical protein